MIKSALVSISFFVFMIWVTACDSQKQDPERTLESVSADDSVDLHSDFVISNTISSTLCAESIADKNYALFNKARGEERIESIAWDSINIFRLQVRAYFKLIDSIQRSMVAKAENINLLEAETLRVQFMRSIDHRVTIDQTALDLLDERGRSIDGYARNLVGREWESHNYNRYTPEELYDVKSDRIFSWPWSAFKNQTLGECLEAFYLLKLKLALFDANVTSAKRKQLNL